MAQPASLARSKSRASCKCLYTIYIFELIFIAAKAYSM